MKSLAWKLAAVAAVMGIGFLVLLQAQRGMNQAALGKPADAQAVALGAESPPATPPAGASQDRPDEHPAAAAADAPSQSEPQMADGAKSGPAPATAGATGPATATSLAAPASPKPDAGPPPLKTADAARRPAIGSAPPGGDPFSDFGDAKRPTPASDSGKSATTSPPDSKAAGDVKQASATGEESVKGKTPPGNAPSAAATGPSGPPALMDLKAAPVGQSEPADKTDNSAKDSGAKDNGAKNDSAGPQLFGPGAPQDTPAPTPTPTSTSTTTPPPKTADAGPSPAAVPLPTSDAKKESASAGAGKGGPEPTSFPSLDDETAAPAPNTASSGKDGPRTPPSGQRAAAAPAAAHPDPFPLDQAKEVPLTKLPEPKTADAKPDARTAEPGSGPTQLPVAGSADSSAASASSSSPRPATDVHTEPPADFQGDGTVGEQAPLGPQRPQLNIEKIAPPNALIGQPLVYSILVKNVGTSEAHDIVVEDRIPKGTKLSGTIPRAELTGKKLIWRLGNLGPSEQRKISIRVIPLEAGEIGSVATVNFVSEAAAETVVTAPRIEFELSAPRDVKLGQTVPFHFTVKNVGTGEARGIVIRDVIPEGLSHGSGNDLEYEIGRLPPGKWKELTLELRAIKTGPTVNRAIVVGEGGLSVKAEAAIEISGAKIGLSRSGPPRRYLGRPAIYANTLVNESKYEVEGVVAVETVPAGMDFAGATHGGQFNEGTRSIAWRIERMAPGETCVLKSKLVPKGTGAQNSTVRVSVPNGEPAEASSQTLVEGFAALGVEVAGVEGPVDVGEKINLRINARNKGTMTATNVVVTVEIPEQMTIVSIRGPGKRAQEGNQVQFGPIPMLEGRTAATCELVLAAKKRGDSRIHVSLRADQIDKPLSREESVLVLSESAER